MYILILLSIIIFSIILYNVNYNYNIKIRKNVNVKKRLIILKDLYNIILDSIKDTDIKLFLTYGTLLGKIRENKIICYDYDLDFGINEKDFF